MVSQSWKDMSEEERFKWSEMARLDRERYDREKAAYHGPWKVLDTKDSETPKKPMSAFLAFGNERRQEIVAAHPDLSNAQVSQMLS